MQLDPQSVVTLGGVDPALVHVVVKAANLSDVPFAIVQGLRTQAQQDALYEQGRTTPGLIVTWTRNSKHIEGKAVDFSAIVDGERSWDETLFPHIASYFFAAANIADVPIIWGGDWHTKDWGHIQLRD